MWLSADSGWDEFGWGQVAHIEVTLGARGLDHCDEIENAKAAGHTLHFKVGSGDKPGIYGHKDQCKMMCNLDMTTGWKSVPAAEDLNLTSEPDPWSPGGKEWEKMVAADKKKKKSRKKQRKAERKARKKSRR
jgi:hypothetical protein